MDIFTTIEQLYKQGVFTDLDIYFAKFILTLAQNNNNEELLLSSVLVSHLTTQGHTGLDLTVWAGQLFPAVSEPGMTTLSCPDFEPWLAALQKSNSVVGQPGDYAPLILEQCRLYLYRYWDYEQQLATHIRVRASRQHIPNVPINYGILTTRLSHLFIDKNQLSEDKQRQAVLTAVSHQFSVISGGPGTGKTTTIIKILVLLLQENLNLTIALAAPTGKAAARLQETIKQTLPQLNCAEHIKLAIPREAYTIHRLLSKQFISSSLPNNMPHLLPYDVVIIDEASMVDLALMTQLAQAIPLSSRWILVGDQDQLTSVEAGSVLSDIGKASDSSPSHFLQKRLVCLDKNYRFRENDGIELLAQAVNQGQAETAWQILTTEKYPQVTWNQLGTSGNLPFQVIEQVITHFQQSLAINQPEVILQQLEQLKILCATRWGNYGAIAINRRLEEELSKRGLIRTQSPWYHGRPIIITRNDYTLKLFNGDIGIILRDTNSQQRLRAFFPGLESGQYRCFWPNRLPEHETVYAMTIHKSQGSEFKQVLILLPPQFSPLFTREWIYTGITRARHGVSIWGDEQVFKAMVAGKMNRVSGLYEKLVKAD
jgi:exodeoxyribonuclease V alpha subunit